MFASDTETALTKAAILSALVGNLTFERCLLRKCSVQRIPIGSIIDFEQEISLLYKLVVMDTQADERPSTCGAIPIKLARISESSVRG